MKNAIERLRGGMHDIVGSAERVVAEKIAENPSVVPHSTIRELADMWYVSTSTIVRLCQSLGFSGYREFRQAVTYEMAMYDNSKKVVDTDIEKSDTIEDIAKKITYKNIRSLEETLNLIDPTKFNQCVDALCKCKNLYIFGLGASMCVAKDAYLKFLRINKPCQVSEDWHAQLLMAKNATPEDLGIIISYSGETEEMVKCLEQLNQNNCPTIAITRFARSTIASKATHVLYTSANESLFRTGASASRISQLNMIDMLYSAYASYNYDECMDRFTRTHIEKPNTKKS